MRNLIIKLLESILKSLKRKQREKKRARIMLKIENARMGAESDDNIIYQKTVNHVKTEYRFKINKEFLGIYVDGKLASKPAGDKKQFLDDKMVKEFKKIGFELIN